MSTGMLQLCRSSVRNTVLLRLKPAFSRGQATSIATGPSVVRRVVTKRTHFLSLPLYEGAAASKVAELRQVWRQRAESASLEPGIIIPSIKHALSLKLGNINIKGSEGTTITVPFYPNSTQPQEEPPAFERDEVVKVMEELKEPIRQLLTSHGMEDVLRVPLGGIVPLLHGRPDHFNPRKVNVLFLRPAEGKSFDVMTQISNLVHDKFSANGMLAGTPRFPPMANLTLINTANRQGYVRAPGLTRRPFNLLELYQIEGFNAFRTHETEALPRDLGVPLSLNLGVAEVRSLKLDPVVPGLPSDEVKGECEAEVTFST